MPNWTSNAVEAEGIGLLPIYDEEGNFDFNKIIPMPEELDLESGSITDEAIVYFLTERLRDRSSAVIEEFNEISSPLFFASKTENFENAWTRAQNHVEADHDEEELYNLGRKYVGNYIKYGYVNWYDWRIHNWGTKWNASDTYTGEGEDIVCFDTAWSPPIPVITALSTMYPDENFTFSYINEDEQEVTWFAIFRAGKVIEEWIEENEIEEYEEESESPPEELEDEIYIEDSEELDTFLKEAVTKSGGVQ